MSQKKLTLILTVVAIVPFILKYSEILGLCSRTNYECLITTDKVEHILYIVPLALLFSIVTYFAKESVFHTWWQFSRYAIPVVLLVSVIVSLELHHEPGGWFNMDNETDIMITTLTYFLFILGSIIAIIRGYRK